MQPFLPFANKTFNSPSWSIGVEFYTYLVFAFTVLFASGKKRLSIVSSFVVLLAGGLLVFYGNNGLSAMPGWNFLRCILGFFLGVLSYNVYDSYHPKISPWSGKIALVLLGVLAVFLSFKEKANLDYLVAPIFAALTIAIATEPRGYFKNVEPDSAAMVGQGFLFDLHGTPVGADVCVLTSFIRAKVFRPGYPQLARSRFCIFAGHLGFDHFSNHLPMD